MNGAPEGIRTPDRSVRSRLLYPAELRVRDYEKLNGAPEGIRTPDRSVRSRLLYPAELRVRTCEKNLMWRTRRDSNP